VKINAGISNMNYLLAALGIAIQVSHSHILSQIGIKKTTFLISLEADNV
jgi:hypothetical protein